LLRAADELFYAEGVHVVGVDRIVERAGVTKATLYNTFGSKDDLVRAYLEEHMRRRRERIDRILAANDTPRARITGIFGEVAKAHNAAVVPFMFEGFGEDNAMFQPDGVHPIAAAQGSPSKPASW